MTGRLDALDAERPGSVHDALVKSQDGNTLVEPFGKPTLHGETVTGTTP